MANINVCRYSQCNAPKTPTTQAAVKLPMSSAVFFGKQEVASATFPIKALRKTPVAPLCEWINARAKRLNCNGWYECFHWIWHIARFGIIGPVCSGFANDNGSRLLDFCASNDLRVGSSWFPRMRIHQLTWYSNDGITRKVLDHVIISRRWFSCMTSCRVFRNAGLLLLLLFLFAF